MKIKKLEKEIQVLHQKTNINFEHCKLQPDDICSPCLCVDHEKLLTIIKSYCDCQNLQPKRDWLEHKQVGRKINGVYKIHQNIFKTIQIYWDQTTDGAEASIFEDKIEHIMHYMVLFYVWTKFINK